MPKAIIKTGKAGGGSTNGQEELEIEEAKSAVVASVAEFLRNRPAKAGGGGGVEFDLTFELDW